MSQDEVVEKVCVARLYRGDASGSNRPPGGRRELDLGEALIYEVWKI